MTQLATPQGTINYTYDNANRRATMQQVGTGTTSYTFDAADRLTALANPFSETTSWEYDTANRCTKETFANGVYSEFGFDARGRQTSVAHRNSSGVALSSESYVYDVAGNLSSKTVDSVATSYTYDALDQLLSESRSGYSASYSYDGNGNRLTKTLNGVTEDYHYDDGDKLTSITQGLGTLKSFAYDAQGRTTSVTTPGGTTNYSYDYEDRLTGIGYPSSATNAFAYNAFDTRVGKTDSGGTASFMRDGVGVCSPVLSDGSSSFTPGVSQRSGSASTFQAMDRLGTFSVETNATQSVSATRQFDAFGNPTGTTGTPTTPFAFAGAWGYQQDPDSNLKLLGHRYYDASTGRFLTRDSAKDGRNWLGYCSNNPTKRVDPWGLKQLYLGIAITGIFGFLSGEGSAGLTIDDQGNVGFTRGSGLGWGLGLYGGGGLVASGGPGNVEDGHSTTAYLASGIATQSVSIEVDETPGHGITAGSLGWGPGFGGGYYGIPMVVETNKLFNIHDVLDRTSQNIEEIGSEIASIPDGIEKTIQDGENELMRTFTGLMR